MYRQVTQEGHWKIKKGVRVPLHTVKSENVVKPGTRHFRMVFEKAFEQFLKKLGKRKYKLSGMEFTQCLYQFYDCLVCIGVLPAYQTLELSNYRSKDFLY